MQRLARVLLYMIRLSVAVSFAKLGNSARNGWTSTTARIDATLAPCSRLFTAKLFCSTSATSSDAGQESATSKNFKRKLEKPVAQGSRNVSREYVNGGINNVEKFKGQARQNSAGRRVPEIDRGATPPRDDRSRPKAAPKNAYEEFTQEFRQVIRSRQFGPAMALYARMKEIKLHPRESVLTGLLSICQKKEHLVNAVEIFADFISSGIPPNESAYMALIRCYSDNGQIDEALELIEQMNMNNLEPKLRTYHPVLEAVCKNNDFKGAIMIIKQMQTGSVVPRSEQLTLLLEVAASSKSLDFDEGRVQIDELLQTASIDLLGMETEEMRRVVAAFSDMSLSDVVDEGILVETREDLPGEILEINDDNDASVVTSMNSTYPSTPTLLADMICSPIVSDNTVPLGFDFASSTVKFQPDIYTIASESEMISGEDSKILRNRRARMVDISRSTSLCPNCGGELIPLLLDEEERKRVRIGLMKIASATSTNQLRNMQNYGEWLKNQTEYKYIIDGANVAYSHQNFDSGKFSYRQIELVVNKMLARGDGKVLVLLPYSYAQKVVPNNSKQRGRRNLSYLSATELRILQRFDEEGMLYLVPQGADDDWYWIYATVTEARENAAYVVTNDLMRDHRLAFLEPRPFIRWRTTQVMNFCFSKAAKEDTVDPEAYIIDPAKYSREIQNSLESQEGKDIERWHIPAADRRAWLCLTTGSSKLSSPSSSTVPKSSFIVPYPTGVNNVTSTTSHDEMNLSKKMKIERSDNQDSSLINKIPKKSIEIINDNLNDINFGVQKTQFIAQERRKLY